jgi:hypothetical protein
MNGRSFSLLNSGLGMHGVANPTLVWSLKQRVIPMKTVKSLYQNLYGTFFDVFAAMATVHSLHPAVATEAKNTLSQHKENQNNPKECDLGAGHRRSDDNV